MKEQKRGTGYFFVIIAIFILSLSRPIIGQVSHPDSLVNNNQKDISHIVNENRIAANRWWYTWFVGYSVATVAQTGIAMTSPELKTRQDMWNGAATTFLGAAGLLLTPLVPKESEIKKKTMSGKEPGHIYNDSDFSVAMLKEIARREKFGRSWKVHAITGVVNIGSGLVTWLGFDRTIGDGLVTFAINTAITEAQIWTQPIRAKRDYENYIKIHGNGRLAGPTIPSRQFLISATPGGVNLRLKF